MTRSPTAHFDADKLARQLSMLPHPQRVAFAASCAERMLPNYAAFAREAGWGHPNVLREAMDMVWQWLLGVGARMDLVPSMIQKCEAVTPDTNDFSTVYTSAALDTATSVAETLRLLVDHDVSHAVHVASFSHDTIDMYIQERDHLDFNRDPQFDDKIIADPLMKDEINRQNGVLDQLRCVEKLDPFIVNRIRTEAANRGISNIGVSA